MRRGSFESRPRYRAVFFEKLAITRVFQAVERARARSGIPLGEMRIKPAWSRNGRVPRG